MTYKDIFIYLSSEDDNGTDSYKLPLFSRKPKALKNYHKNYKFHEQCLVRPICVETCERMKKRLWTDFFRGILWVNKEDKKPRRSQPNKETFLHTSLRIINKEEWKEETKEIAAMRRSNKRWKERQEKKK